MLLLLSPLGCIPALPAEIADSSDADTDTDTDTDTDADGDADTDADTDAGSDTGSRDGDGDGYSPASGDCDDEDAAIHPGAGEVCDGFDNDCDALVDDDDSGLVGAPTWYRDRDADGYGDPVYAQASCLPPSDYVVDGTDCLDTDPAINPAATEIYNLVDDNCNGVTDGIEACPASDVEVQYQRNTDGAIVTMSSGTTYYDSSHSGPYVGITLAAGCLTNATISTTSPLVLEAFCGTSPDTSLDYAEPGSPSACWRTYSWYWQTSGTGTGTVRVTSDQGTWTVEFTYY